MFDKIQFHLCMILLIASLVVRRDYAFTPIAATTSSRSRSSFASSIHFSSQQQQQLENSTIALSPRLFRYSLPKKNKWQIRKTKTLRNFCITSFQTNKSIVMTKTNRETLQHCLGKFILWDIYHQMLLLMNENEGETESSPSVYIEKDIGDRCVPDVVAFAAHDSPSSQQGYEHEPIFWGESGRLSIKKALDISTRFPHCPILHLRWHFPTCLDFSKDLEYQLEVYKKFGNGENETEYTEEDGNQQQQVKQEKRTRNAPFHFILFKKDPIDCLNDDGVFTYDLQDDLEWRTVWFDDENEDTTAGHSTSASSPLFQDLTDSILKSYTINNDN